MTGSDDMPTPWLSIVGIGEDGLDGLSAAARDQLARAELIVGGPRHLDLVASLGKPTLAWDDPVRRLDRKTADASRHARGGAVLGRSVLVRRGLGDRRCDSGGGNHRGAGAVDLRLRPRRGCAGGWRRPCTLGLHARPIDLLRPHLRNGARMIVLARDGAAPGQIASYLTGLGFGPSRLTVLEALGGPRERVRGHHRGDLRARRYSIAGRGRDRGQRRIRRDHPAPRRRPARRVVHP